jgi:transposase
MLAQIALAHPGKRIDTYFQDETRFGQQGTLARGWARRGQRFTAIRQTKYDWLYVLAAACPQTGHAVGMLSPYINVEIINIFLAEFTKEIPEDVQVVMVWDQAGFHTGKKLRVPKNITIVPLPAYSPELNPLENLWHYLRSHYWSNRTFEDYEALVDAAEEAWQRSVCNPTTIQSICRASYTIAQ